MRPGEVLKARRRAPVAWVPVSPLEWHGPHMPIGTDGLHAWNVCRRAAREVGGVVLPPLFAGTDTVRLPGDAARVVGMDFPGFPVRSVYFEESAFGLTVRSVVQALRRDDYRLIVLAN